MQYQDNHMDDLFRQAADNYPLKTGENNWDDIAPLLMNNAGAGTSTAGKNKRSKNLTRFSLLLFLILASGLAAIFITNSEKSSNNLPVKTDNIKEQAITANSNRDEIVSDTRQDAGIKIIQVLSKENTPAVHPYKNIINPVIKEIEKQGAPAVALTSLNNPALKEITAETPFILPTSDAVTNKQPAVSADEKTDESVETTGQLPIALKENETTAVLPVIKNKTKKQKGLYAGAVAGVGYNVVKGQVFTKPGLELGVKAGYRFNKNLSAETGLIYAKKYYYSDGKFFNMDKMPAGMQVINLNGSSNIFEIPVKLKYNFWLKNNSKIFTTAGITSFILSKEKNNYLALVNGSRQNISSIYKDSYKYFAAAAELSIGYEFNLQKNKTLRIEPYLQIPLRGIGVGKMPVTGTGLHIGYTIFKK